MARDPAVDPGPIDRPRGRHARERSARRRRRARGLSPPAQCPSAHPADLGDRRLVLPAGPDPPRRVRLAQRLQPGLPDDGHAQSPLRADRDHRRLGQVARRDRRRPPDALGTLRPRQPHQDRHSHPRGRRGPGRGEPHGHQRQPDHLAHVPHRRCHGRRGRRPVRHPVQPDQSVHGLHPRAQGLHRRRAGRHRQHPGGDDGRARAWTPRGVRRLLSLAVDGRRLRRRVQGHLRVLDPHPDSHLPAEGPPRRGRERARVIAPVTRAARAWLDQPLVAAVTVTALLGVTAYGVSHFPRSIVVFMLFQASILLLYLARLPGWLKGVLTAAALGVLMPVLGSINAYYLEIAIQVGIFVALALGLNIVVGLAGLLDLGYVAFFAVGAYSWAIFGSPQANQIFGGTTFPLSGWWFFVFLFVAIGVAAAAGILLGLPVLRLHGDYLAIVTLGFGEVIRVLANNLDKPINITNGPKGITPISRPPIFFEPLLRGLGIDVNPNVVYPLYLYFLVLGIVGITILVNRRLEDSHIGRAWEAIREDQTAAQAMGVPLVRMKLLAFACGASFAGAVGVLFSAKQIFINPESFTFMESIGVLSMIILGGMGSIPGAILGAAVVTVLNLQVLKGISLWLNELRNAGTVILGYNLANLPTQLEPAKYERMVFGLILVLMMIFRPQGILPARRRTRELGEP